MDDISTLQVRVQSTGVGSTTDQLRGLASQAGRTESATGGLMKTVGRMVGTYLTATAAIRGFNAVIQQVRSFEVLRAAITTAVGSVEKMEVAWGALVKFAATTPFDLDNSVNAFTKMINYGLAPSEKAMMSFGDTAAAMRTSLEEVAEAVAKANSGEFDPLRKYAITAKRDGDEITFAFRGVKTTVKNSIEEIQKYFVELGEKNFAGAMENRMKTLDGAFSNLGDTWNQFKYKIGTSTGIAEQFRGALLGMTTSIEQLGNRFESGEITANLKLWGEAFHGAEVDAYSFFHNAGTNMSALVRLIQIESGASKEAVDRGMTGGWKGFVDFMLTVPASVRFVAAEITAQVEYIGRTLGTVVANAKGDLTSFFEGLGSWSTIALGRTTPINKPPGALGGNLWQSNSSLASEQAGQQSLREAEAKKAQAERQAIQIEEADRKLDEARAASQAAYDKTLKGVADQQAKVDLYTDDTSLLPPPLKPGEGGDQIAAVAPKNPNAAVVIGEDGKGGGGGGRHTGAGGSGGSDEYKQLLKELQTEEQAISSSLAARLVMIQANTEATSAARAQASLKAIDLYEKDEMAEIDRRKNDQATMWAAFAEEEKLIKDTYERRKQIILAATSTTEAERQKLLSDAEKKYVAEIGKHNEEVNTKYLDGASKFFSDLASMQSVFGKKGFKIAQAAAIAGATIDMWRASTKAYAEGGPYAGPIFAAAALAAGAANIAKISSQSYSGAYAEGGIVPGTSTHGDRLTARVNSGEMVLNKSQQANLFAMANGAGGGGGRTIVNIANYGPPENIQQRSSQIGDAEVIDIIVGKAVAQVANNIRSGGTPVSQAIEQTYPVRRRAR